MTGRDKLLEQGLAAFKKNNYNGIALLPTGSGKGRLMIEIIKLLKPKSILYLCDREELRDKMFIDELHKWDASHLLNIIDRECYQTAYKWVGKHYDVVLADEFDASLTDKYSLVYKNNTFLKKILVSATLDDKKRIKAKEIAPIIFERKQAELIENNVLNKIQYYFINYDLNRDETTRYIAYNKRFTELLNKPQNANTAFALQKVQIQRKQFLSSLQTSVKVTKWLLNSLRKRNEKILIFCGLSEQADKVSHNSYHSVNGNLKALRDFEAGIELEMSVVEKVTRGVNIPGVRNIVLEHFGKGKTALTQKIGRGLRLAVDETLNVFILIPYFKHPLYGRKATVIQDWLLAATKDMNLSNAKIVNYVEN